MALKLQALRIRPPLPPFLLLRSLFLQTNVLCPSIKYQFSSLWVRPELLTCHSNVRTTKHMKGCPVDGILRSRSQASSICLVRQGRPKSAQAKQCRCQESTETLSQCPQTVCLANGQCLGHPTGTLARQFCHWQRRKCHPQQHYRRRHPSSSRWSAETTPCMTCLELG